MSGSFDNANEWERMKAHVMAFSHYVEQRVQELMALQRLRDVAEDYRREMEE